MNKLTSSHNGDLERGQTTHTRRTRVRTHTTMFTHTEVDYCISVAFSAIQ